MNATAMSPAQVVWYATYVNSSPANPTLAPHHVVRTVTENSRTLKLLKFEQAGFEED